MNDPVLYTVSLGMVLGGIAAVLGVALVAALTAVRLWVAGRRAAGVLGLLGASLLGGGSLFMPVELALFASLDSGRSPMDMLEDIFDEPWFLVAWAVLMLLTALPGALNAVALWLAVPWRALGEGDGADQGQASPER